MRWKLTEPRNRPYLIASVILLVGFGSAIVIYLTAAIVPDTLLEFSPDSSKKYLRDLQLYGGTANVLAVELNGLVQRVVAREITCIHSGRHHYCRLPRIPLFRRTPAS